MVEVGLQCSIDADCSTNMECGETGCACYWAWGMAGIRCTEVTPAAAFVLITRAMIACEYLLPLVYVIRLLYRRRRTYKQLCRLDYTLSTLIWVTVTCFLTVGYQSFQTRRQFGYVQSQIAAERPLLQLVESVSAYARPIRTAMCSSRSARSCSNRCLVHTLLPGTVRF